MRFSLAIVVVVLSALASSLYVNTSKRMDNPLRQMTADATTIYGQVYAMAGAPDSYEEHSESVKGTFTTIQEVDSAGWTITFDENRAIVHQILTRLGDAFIDEFWPKAGRDQNNWRSFRAIQNKPYITVGGVHGHPATGAVFEGIMWTERSVGQPSIIISTFTTPQSKLSRQGGRGRYTAADLPRINTFSDVISAIWGFRIQGHDYTPARNQPPNHIDAPHTPPTPAQAAQMVPIRPPRYIIFLDLSGYVEGLSVEEAMDAIIKKDADEPEEVRPYPEESTDWNTYVSKHYLEFLAIPQIQSAAQMLIEKKDIYGVCVLLEIYVNKDTTGSNYVRLEIDRKPYVFPTGEVADSSSSSSGQGLTSELVAPPKGHRLHPPA